MTRVLHDLRYALRGLRQNRGFTLVAILSLALGIGANTTIFTLIRALFLREFPVRNSESLVAMFTVDSRTPNRQLTSYPNYRDLRDRNTVFSSLLLYVPVTITLTGRGDPQLLMAQLVTGNYFDTLGVHPTPGRGFLPEEDPDTNGPAVAVISYALWHRLYAGDPHITGRTIELNGRPFAIVGVAPKGFSGLNQLYGADVFVPVSTYSFSFPVPAMVPARRIGLFSAVGRLKPGIGRPQAEAALQPLAQELERQFPRENQGRRVQLTSIAEAAINDRTRPVILRAGTLLMAISGLVLLVGCGNVANLVLARAASRTKEIALRLAVGASRTRLIQQLLIESLLLSALGGLAGLLMARWARDLLWAIRGPNLKHASFELQLDWAVLGFNFAVSALMGLLFGLAPALRATRVNLVDDLKERTASLSGGLRGAGAARSVLVVAQVSMALVTLIGAGLFLHSLRDAGRIDPGFDHAHLGIVVYNVNDQGYNQARGMDYHQRALERAAAVPGVVSATISRDAPMLVSNRRGIRLDGRDSPDTPPRLILTAAVWPGYLRTIGIPLLRGRDFSQLDSPSSPRVAILNETAATTLWPGEDPIGKRITFPNDNTSVEVVGISRTVNYMNLGEEPQPLLYLSLRQYYFPTAVIYVRTAGEPERIVAAVKRELQPLDRNLMLQAESFDVTIRELLWSQRLSAALLTVFGMLALLLSVVGIYGVISYSVRQRHRELGVRMALGATPREVQYLVLGEGVRLITFGVIVGSILSLALAGSVESMLFLKSSRDMFTFTLVPAILTVVGVAACWLPARRSSRTDPSVALREE
jgi:putative ABC transport system permease protein